MTGNGAQAIFCTAGADLPWLMISPRKRGKCLAPDVPCATRSFWHVSNANAALWSGGGGGQEQQRMNERQAYSIETKTEAATYIHRKRNFSPARMNRMIIGLLRSAAPSRKSPGGSRRPSMCRPARACENSRQGGGERRLTGARRKDTHTHSRATQESSGKP